MRELSDFEKEAVRLALVKLFDARGYFDICTLDQVLKVTGAVPDEREYRALRTLHCVYYSTMTLSMREEVVKRTLAIVSGPEIDLSTLHQSFLPTQKPPAVEARPAGIWKRLIGGAA